MKKPFLITGIVAAVSFMLLVNLGCQKARQKFKIPKMNFITTEDVHGVIAPDDDNIWIVGDAGIIMHSNDGGKTWKNQNSGVETIICDGVFLDNQTGWLVGIRGVVLHTTDAGKTWTKQNTDTKRHLFGISFVDKQYGWAAGEYNTILHTTDGGINWQQQTEELDKIYSTVQFTDRENGWAVGEHALIMHTSDGGRNWERVVPEFFKRANLEEEYENPLPPLFGVYFEDKQKGWICGLDSTIIHTTDGGQNWQQLPNDGEHALYTVFVKGGRGWAVGNNGAYLQSFDGGITWQVQLESIKSKFWFRDVFFSSPDKGFVVGARGTVVETTDGGKTWDFLSGLPYDFEGFEIPEPKRIEE